jgi:hypothetical protein
MKRSPPKAADVLSVLGWSLTCLRFENDAEVFRVLHAHPRSDLGDREIGFDEQSLRVTETGLQNVVVDRATESLLEVSLEHGV